jgi:hypothetical protein
MKCCIELKKNWKFCPICGKSIIVKDESTKPKDNMIYPKDMVIGESYYLTGMYWADGKCLINTPVKVLSKHPAKLYYTGMRGDLVIVRSKKTTHIFCCTKRIFIL